MDYKKALEFLKSTAFMGSVPGLDRLDELLEKMGNPQKKLKYIHIAGTNGKGSTSAMTAEILMCAKYRVGVFSSPFLVDFREQIAINGDMISRASVCEVADFIKEVSVDIKVLPTEFELTVALALEHFVREGCDIVILECGMGGRLDATNVIENKEVAVLTSISLDHCSFLGDTIEAIADNKSDIIKNDCAVVAYPQCEEVKSIILSKAPNAVFADFSGIRVIKEDTSEQIFDCGNYKNIRLRLIGEYQRHNCAVVLEVVKTLIAMGYDITENDIYKGLYSVFIPARLEILSKKPLFILDGGHNVDCVCAVKNAIPKYIEGKNVIALVGVMADKDYRAMFDIINTISKAYVAVQPNNPRALKLEDIKNELKRFDKPVYAMSSVEDGVEKALEIATDEDIIIALGSLYMAGDIKKCFKDC